jgi:potassium efflux system protein
LVLRILFFTLIEDRVSVVSDLNARIHERFAEEGIEIPFPQRDLHVRSVDEGVSFPTGPEPAS